MDLFSISHINLAGSSKVIYLIFYPLEALSLAKRDIVLKSDRLFSVYVSDGLAWLRAGGTS